MHNNHCCRVVLTGGPGGGKTTAADLFRRELGEDVVIVPEAATILYTGGFPRSEDPDVRRSIQSAIYHVQRNLEDIQSTHYKSRVLLCDRGTVDGAAYWPEADSKGFFDFLSTSIEKELARYDHVVFFETAAVGGMSIEGGNPTRIENLDQAILLDKKLRALWSQHPKFHFVPHQKSFLGKISTALFIMSSIVKGQSKKK
ncbi:MAG: AAA family ATPase [Bdellovibrionales bacterium]|nr:AAA family ATPase [Bdellovibrionales bacterium]